MKKNLITIGISCTILVVAVIGWFLLMPERTFEPVNVDISFRLDIELAEHILQEDAPRFQFILESVAHESEMVVPMPEIRVIEAEGMRDAKFAFNGLEFESEGIFRYRMAQEMLEMPNGLFDWLIDESVFDITITVAADEGELVADVVINEGQLDEIVFKNDYEVSFLGLWEAGMGDRMAFFERAHRITFLSDGTLEIMRHGTEWGGGTSWELNDQGQLVMEKSWGDSYLLEVSVLDEILTLRDVDGYKRTWSRENVEKIQNTGAQPFLGVWEYGFGDAVHGFGFNGVERDVEFLANGTVVFANGLSDWSWHLNEDGQIVVGTRNLGDATVDFEVEADQLIITNDSGRRRTWQRAGTREEHTDLAFFGAWEYGLGDALACFRHTHIVDFSSDGTLIAYERGDSPTTNSMSWELGDGGVLLMDCSWSVLEFTVEVDGNILTITDAEDNVRSWRRVGNEETRAMPNPDFMLGAWEYGHGHRLAEVGIPETLEFSPDGSVYGVTFRSVPWQLNEAGKLIMGIHATELMIEVEDDVLTIMDELGNTRTWLRAGTGTSEGRHWLIEDYLGYFTVEEGYEVVDNISFLGHQLDFVVYRLAPDGEEWGPDYVIIVKRYGEVIDVLRHHSWNAGINHVIEVDLNGDGQKDVLLFHGAQGNSAWGQYSAFLQTDWGMIEVPEFNQIRNPRICPTSGHLLASWRDTCCIHGWEVYTFIGNEVVMTEQLVRNAHGHGDRELWTERLLIDGHWQEREVCFTDDEEWGDTLCPNDNDPILYERIFGENAYWNHRWSHLADATWD